MGSLRDMTPFQVAADVQTYGPAGLLRHGDGLDVLADAASRTIRTLAGQAASLGAFLAPTRDDSVERVEYSVEYPSDRARLGVLVKTTFYLPFLKQEPQVVRGLTVPREKAEALLTVLNAN